MNDKQVPCSIVGVGVVGDAFFIDVMPDKSGESVRVYVDDKTFYKMMTISDNMRGEVEVTVDVNTSPAKLVLWSRQGEGWKLLASGEGEVKP